MEFTTIDKLPELEELTNDDLFAVDQEEVTKSVTLKKVNNFIHSNTMIEVNELLEAEAEARIQGDENTLEKANEYTDREITKNKLAVNEWLAPVKTVSQIPLTGLDNTRNYLIKVVADPNSGVYQAVAGWEDEPEWELYNNTVDFVDESEMKSAIETHNTDEESHEDIRAIIQSINEDYVNETDVDNMVTSHNQNINSHIDIRDIIKNHIGIPEWDNDNYILTFTAENGVTLEVDIPLESLAKGLDYDPLTKELVITRQDGTEIRVSVSDLIDAYEGSEGGHIQITVSNNVIRASLLAGSVTENELSNSVLELIDSKIGSSMIGEPDGIASLDGGGKVPLTQLPEIVTGDAEATKNLILEKIFYVGKGYSQGINDKDPIEAGLPGQWAIWTGRAEAYRLTTSALPSFTTYTSGANYAANAYVLWHLSGAGYELFKAKAAITNASTQLDPILWEKYVLGDIIERRHLQGWLDNDLAVGATVAGGTYAGRKVSEVIALGGTFPSWEGGNRPRYD